ncbi:E3 ubiquitin-protein ligase TRIM7-like [Paroedura picta]|uniref:E3 ubiquitin-protein ligase TRIM7-like n=1 Tax=Paroedura picta TaxID=143630 RepID=UPI0040577E71
MASGGPVEELCEEASCAVCLDFFRDPVVLAECGHSFCRACLARCWGESARKAPCPQCRRKAQPGNLTPNRQLASVAEIARKLRRQQGTEDEPPGGVCEKRREPLELCRKDDEAPLRVVGDGAQEQPDRTVAPADEAAQEDQDEFCSCLQMLKKKGAEITAHKTDVAVKSQDLLRQTGVERQKVVAELRKMHQFLEEQEKLLLAQVEEVEKEIAREKEQELARLSTELSSLESLIQEVEKKIQHPVAEFLQDTGSTLQRCEEKEEGRNPAAFTLKLMWRVQELCDRTGSLEVNLSLFKDTLPFQLRMQKAANVILDPNTANPHLILSEDRKSVRWESTAQELPRSPERFDNYPVVLGCEGFMEGCHYWECSVGSKGLWTVGVAKNSVSRKGPHSFSPEGGIWAVEKYGISYYGRCFYPRPYPPLSLSGELKRVRVHLNYPEGHVTFFDGDRNTLLYKFSDASFQGETLFPFFQVFRSGHVSLSL